MTWWLKEKLSIYLNEYSNKRSNLLICNYLLESGGRSRIEIKFTFFPISFWLHPLNSYSVKEEEEEEERCKD